MQKIIHRILILVSLLVLGQPVARAFSLAGPYGNAGDAWQAVPIGYGPPTDIYGPKNIGEGYRRNVPVIYYAYDTAFLDYFGTVGATNLDKGFGIFNNILTNGVSYYYSNLTSVPFDPSHLNYTAQGLELLDLKSLMMNMMMEQFGLAHPENFVWKLHNRYLPPGGKCPADELYTVIQRNYQMTATPFNQIQYSSYVNNELYDFEILEDCVGPVDADTTVFPDDPSADSFTSVAGDGQTYGTYYTTLSQDDVAGLMYLYNPTNVNTETVEGGSLLFDQSTNFSQGQVLFPANTNSPTGWGTFNLGSLLSFARTNSPAAVQAAFPGVIISSSTTYFSLATNATVTAVLLPPPLRSPVGTPPTVGLVTNYSVFLATNYITTFANVVTNYYSPNTRALLQTVTTGTRIGAPSSTGLVTTTNYSTIILSNVPSGSFYFVPVIGTNLCGSGIQYTGLTSVISVTNLITAAFTNVLTATNTSPFTFSQSVITSYTNYTYVAYPVSCTQDAGATALYEGINKLQFVRVDYDSLLGQTIQPFTNSFTMVAITNSQTRTEHFDRLVTAPDLILDSQDLAEGPASPIFISTFAETVPPWNQANILPGLAGPGTINSPATFTFNRSGDVFLNGSLATYYANTNLFIQGLYQNTQYQLLAYGSFDGTTNAPVVYPNGSSIQNLQNLMLVQLSPTSLANGNTGVAYPNVQFTASGGALVAPYAWSSMGYSSTLNTPLGTGLPPGMTLSAAGLLSGTPTQSGIYDFTLTLTDSATVPHTVQWFFTLIIN